MADISKANSIYSLKNQGLYMGGARTIIRINGKIATFANTVSWTIDTTFKPIYVIDSVLPTEIAPMLISVKGQIGGFVVPGMGLSGLHLQPNASTFLLNKYITIEVRDIVTDLVLLRVNKAVIVSRAEQHVAQQISQTMFNWEAIGWQEAGDDGTNYLSLLSN